MPQAGFETVTLDHATTWSASAEKNETFTVVVNNIFLEQAIKYGTFS